MRKVRWIYGLAFMSWALAFWLPARVPPAPEPPPAATAAVAATVAAAPITALRYGNEWVEVQARLNRGHFSHTVDDGSTDPLYMEIQLRGLGEAPRNKLTTVLLIDRSGSMAGEKINAARLSAERLLYRLEDGDRFGIVSYGSDAGIDLPLTTLDPLSRNVARRTLQRLEEGGGTHLEGGLATAFRLFASEDLQGRIGRVLLISDGRPTEGSRQHSVLGKWARDFRSLGVSVSTVGVGLDYDADLLERLASDSGGRFHALREVSELGPVLQNEVHRADQIVARNVAFRLPAPFADWVKPLALDVRPEPQPDTNIVWLGDLAAGETRHLVLRIELPTDSHALANAISFPAPELVYRNPVHTVDETLTHPSEAFLLFRSSAMSLEVNEAWQAVATRAATVRYGVGLAEAMRQLERGSTADAERALRELSKELERSIAQTDAHVLRQEWSSLQRLMHALAAPSNSAADLQDLAKQQRAHALELRR